MTDKINIDLTLKEIKTRRKSLFQHIKTRLESIDDLSFIENDDDDLEHAFKKEVQDDLEEFNGWQFDLNKVAHNIFNRDLFECEYIGATEFAKNKLKK